VINAEFTDTLAAVLSRPAIFPVPALAVKLLFGQMGEEVLLASQRVEPARLVTSGYPFQYSDLRRALEAVLKK
jgi:NAD dependent epimerase/dehydratase family enzyme